MEKKHYESPELEIIKFETEDVITASGEQNYYEDDETTFIPNVNG